MNGLRVVTTGFARARPSTLTVLERILMARQGVGTSLADWEDTLFVSGNFHLGHCVREWVLGRIPPLSDMRFELPDSNMRDNVLYDYATEGLNSWGSRWLRLEHSESHGLLYSRLRPSTAGGLIELSESESESWIIIRHPDRPIMRLVVYFDIPTQSGRLAPVRGYRNIRLS